MEKNRFWVGIAGIIWIICLVKAGVHSSLFPFMLFLFLVFAFSIFRLNKATRGLIYVERERERLSLILEDREKIGEIFEDISKLYDTFMEKIDFDDLIKKAKEFAGRILEADIIIVKVLIPDIVDKESISGDEEMKIPHDVIDALLKERKEIFVEDTTKYAPFIKLKDIGIRKVISSNLRTKGTIYGFIAGLNKERRFTNTQQFLLTIFTHHIALLVENAQLLERIRSMTLKREKGNISDLRKLEEKIAVEKRVEEREMELARDIQAKLLPYPLPKIPFVEINALSRASFEVGGDCFDVFRLSDGKWGIIMADVSGKGVPASLIMAMLHSALRALPLSIKENPKECIKRINGHIYDETEENIFISLSYFVISSEESKGFFMNAGGEIPLIYRNEKEEVEEIISEGMVAGLLPQWENGEVKEIEFNEGDILLLYTDGIIEASNYRGELYGEERLKNFLKKKKDLPLDKLLKGLEKEIMRFSLNQPLSDDLTVLAMRYKGR